jgi:phage FluMu protein Com
MGRKIVEYSEKHFMTVREKASLYLKCPRLCRLVNLIRTTKGRSYDTSKNLRRGQRNFGFMFNV